MIFSSNTVKGFFIAEVQIDHPETPALFLLSAIKGVIVFAVVHDHETLVTDGYPKKNLNRIEGGSAVFGKDRKIVVFENILVQEMLDKFAEFTPQSEFWTNMTMKVNDPLKCNIC